MKKIKEKKNENENENLKNLSVCRLENGIYIPQAHDRSRERERERER